MWNKKLMSWCKPFSNGRIKWKTIASVRSVKGGTDLREVFVMSILLSVLFNLHFEAPDRGKGVAVTWVNICGTWKLWCMRAHRICMFIHSFYISWIFKLCQNDWIAGMSGLEDLASLHLLPLIHSRESTGIHCPF